MQCLRLAWLVSPCPASHLQSPYYTNLVPLTLVSYNFHRRPIASACLCNQLLLSTLHPMQLLKLGPLMISSQGSLGDTLREVKPTFFFGVPRYLNFFSLLTTLPPFACFHLSSSTSVLPIVYYISKQESLVTVASIYRRWPSLCYIIVSAWQLHLEMWVHNFFSYLLFKKGITGLSKLQLLRVTRTTSFMNNLRNYGSQSQVKIKHYSVAYFDHITMFKAL